MRVSTLSVKQKGEELEAVIRFVQVRRSVTVRNGKKQYCDTWFSSLKIRTIDFNFTASSVGEDLIEGEDIMKKAQIIEDRCHQYLHPPYDDVPNCLATSIAAAAAAVLLGLLSPLGEGAKIAKIRIFILFLFFLTFLVDKKKSKRSRMESSRSERGQFLRILEERSRRVGSLRVWNEVDKISPNVSNKIILHKIFLMKY